MPSRLRYGSQKSPIGLGESHVLFLGQMAKRFFSSCTCPKMRIQRFWRGLRAVPKPSSRSSTQVNLQLLLRPCTSCGKTTLPGRSYETTRRTSSKNRNLNKNIQKNQKCLGLEMEQASRQTAAIRFEDPTGSALG